MKSLEQLRQEEAEHLSEQGNVLSARGDLEGAIDLWALAHDVLRGHADKDEWLK